MDEKKKKVLLSLARNTIAKSLDLPYEEVDASMYDEKQGAFVTLKKDGQLRGCIGNITAKKPLYKEIETLALAAAYDDYRFEDLSKEEFETVEIEISVLSKPKKIKDLSQFELSRDGIILKIGNSSAVFLPQVADETGWSKEEMLYALSRKAGLNPYAYKRPDAKFMTFTTEIISDL